MKDEYDFTHGKRGAVASNKGKTRITIMLDDFLVRAALAGVVGGVARADGGGVAP